MTALAPLHQAWSRLAVRERRLVFLALTVVMAATLWGLGIAPALRSLKSAPLRLEQLDQQLQTMRGLAAQARELQSRPAVRRDEALRSLESSVRQRLGDRAQISNTGDRVTVTLSGVPPQLLAQWLSQVRGAARVAVQQARLKRTLVGWDGSIVLRLPSE